MTRQLVIGAGEVGNAQAEVLNCDLRDIAPHQGFYSVIHIAFPWSSRFVRNVMAYQGLHEARTVIVHSTVEPGVCMKNGWTYSPITGQHPNLADSLRVIPKPVSGPQAEIAVKLMRNAGIPAEISKASTTELETAKLVDLLVYGANIRIAKEVERYCREHDLDFEQVFRESARRYNIGYQALGLDHRFQRYDIEHCPGPLGGHCVGYPNLALLGDPRLEDLVRPVTKEGWDDALD